MTEGKIAQANGRLRAGNLGVQIQQIGDRLYLRATLPPKPESRKSEPYQQRISLGFRANPAGIKAAESEARKVGGLLATGCFRWDEYAKNNVQAQDCESTIAKFKERYLAEGGSLTTWDGDYFKILKRLPSDQALTVDLLTQTVLGTTPNTKTRKRACMACNALAKFAGLEFDPSPLAGSYGPSKVSPRDIPDDLTIAQWQSKITNPGWRWVFGMMACYGLRPHECFRLDWEEWKKSAPICPVGENTKTGARRIWPCYPEWFDQFELADVRLPKINLERNNEKVGYSATDYFGDTCKLPFKCYDLRHAWAIRTLEFGLDLSLAAQQMGHSVQVHTAQYHHWITDRHHQRAYEALMLRSDRPRPPEV